MLSKYDHQKWPVFQDRMAPAAVQEVLRNSGPTQPATLGGFFAVLRFAPHVNGLKAHRDG
jgi:hypothetical protein